MMLNFLLEPIPSSSSCDFGGFLLGLLLRQILNTNCPDKCCFWLKAVVLKIDVKFKSMGNFLFGHYF